MEVAHKSRFGRFLLGLTTIALLLMLVLLAASLQGRVRLAKEQEAETSVRLEAQKQENAALETALEKADDPEYKQELARGQLGMVSPGQKDFYDVSN